MSGTYQALLDTGYSGEAMYVDKNIRYTGTWMKRFFGKVREQRDTTHFLLDKNQIREIDWNKAEVVVFPIKDLQNIRWFKDKQQFNESADDIIKARYQVMPPDIKITILPEKEEIKGYKCTHLTAHLRLETKDVKKNSSSITNIKQQLWVSDAVPGFGEYDSFHKKLSEKLGVEAERMGVLNFLLRYWDGPIDTIVHQIKDIKGFPVKSIVSVEAIYISNTNSDSGKTISKNIKNETMVLKDAQIMSRLDMSRFEENIPMRIVTVE
ncbi:MAG: hypothetical protein HQK71_04875 [Desulfamplus sp.]|nr:hypothetical protein [Desulfamplus sp.]